MGSFYQSPRVSPQRYVQNLPGYLGDQEPRQSLPGWISQCRMSSPAATGAWGWPTTGWNGSH